MKEFLEQNGYKCWKNEENTYQGGSVTLVNSHYQKRMDTLEEWGEYPPCKCNDKILVNILHSTTFCCPEGLVGESMEISICHELEDGEWADLKIYSVSPENIKHKLEDYEQRVMLLWAMVQINTFGGIK